MYPPNVPKCLSQIQEKDSVLDIGGWALPFNRANYVMDVMPYETRGKWSGQSPQAGQQEWFDRTTWIQRDICDRTPFPFEDKSIDYVICSHTLEDLRDPVWVCSEINRVGKRGYIEVPSRLAEQSKGIERGVVGWSHHRWLVTIDPAKNTVVFMQKYHMIHRSRRFHFPWWFWHYLSEERRVQWLFWQDQFHYEEKIVHGVQEIEFELAAFVRSHRISLANAVASLRARDWVKVFRLLGRKARSLMPRAHGMGRKIESA